MTFKDLLKKHLREDSMDYSILSNINHNILDNEFNENDNNYEIYFKSCSLDDVKELLNDADYPLGVLTRFEQVTGSFNLADFKLQYVTFIDSNLDFIEFGRRVLDVGINKSSVDLLHFKECEHVDYIGMFDCKIGHLIVGECKIETADITKSVLNKIEIFDSSAEYLLFKDNNKKDCHSLKELEEVIFTEENLNKESNGRGLASIYDTGLFDFKIK